jgi:Escherichia/Staphylococcus phage prohead protease
VTIAEKLAARRENVARAVQKRMPVLHAKALGGGDEPGSFEAIVSVFGVADYERDVTEPGSFAESIASAFSPIVWSHDYMTPPIGVTVEMAELDLAQLKTLVPDGVPEGATGGLYGKGRLLVNADDGEDVPLARHVWSAFKSNGGDGRPALREFSWRGAVMLETIESFDDGRLPVYHLDKIDLVEWGPCLKGCNPETTLLAAKSMIDKGAIERSRAISLLGLEVPSASKTADDGDLENPSGADDDADDAVGADDDAPAPTSDPFKAVFAALADVLDEEHKPNLSGDDLAALKTSLESLHEQLRKAIGSEDAAAEQEPDDEQPQRSPTGANFEQTRRVVDVLLA